MGRGVVRNVVRVCSDSRSDGGSAGSASAAVVVVVVVVEINRRRTDSANGAGSIPESICATNAPKTQNPRV